MNRSSYLVLLAAFSGLFIGICQAEAACWECKEINSIPHCVVTTTTGHVTCTVDSTTAGGMTIRSCEETGDSCESDGNTGGNNHGGSPPVDGCEVNLKTQTPRPTMTPHGSPVPWTPRQLSIEENPVMSTPTTTDTRA